jgi:hypothetical protein
MRLANLASPLNFLLQQDPGIFDVTKVVIVVLGVRSVGEPWIASAASGITARPVYSRHMGPLVVCPDWIWPDLYDASYMDISSSNHSNANRRACLDRSCGLLISS